MAIQLGLPQHLTLSQSYKAWLSFASHRNQWQATHALDCALNYCIPLSNLPKGRNKDRLTRDALAKESTMQFLTLGRTAETQDKYTLKMGYSFFLRKWDFAKRKSARQIISDL